MTTEEKCRYLGKVFAAEIHNEPPFQSEDPIYLTLQSEGWVEKVGKGWELTWQGRRLYCDRVMDT